MRIFRSTLLAAMAALCASIATPAAATPPIHLQYPVEVSYPIPELGEICGFDVTITLAGTFKGTLFRDGDGTVVREFDSQPNTLITFSSLTTGKTFSYRFSTVFITNYVDGLEPGAEITAAAHGFLEKVPGLPAAAGSMRFDHGMLLFVDEGGVPIVAYGEPASATGRSNDFEVTDAAICAALAP